MSSKIHIGTSGYQYDHWKDVFYPEDVPKKDWFDHYSKYFDTVEINNTFYNLPKPETVANWRKESPEDFLYVLKYSRYGTHMKKLKDPEEHLENFMEVAGQLDKKLGPILLQLPPGWKAAPQRLKEFLKAAPKDHRWAVEFRDPDWLCKDVYSILKNHNAALVVHDKIKDHPNITTADWVYLRFHGMNKSGNYSNRQLGQFSRKIREHRDAGREVFVYFNNDQKGYAVQNALYLKEKI